MNRPLWILNSFLLFCILFTLIFILFSRPSIPQKKSIETSVGTHPLTEEALKVSTQKIYENDLFGTYQKEAPKLEEEGFVGPMPPPPTPKEVIIPEPPKPEFFDPLNISLKGITVVINNTAKNRAIIADNKTNTERIYKESDMIEDAQLVRILSNKVIFLRSNGQQEVLYLREKDAQEDPSYKAIGDWDDVVQKVGENTYLINADLFAQRIKNLANLIDLFDITTVYKKGSSIGCRIGQLEDQSLAQSLGIQSGDIITRINGIPTTSTANRVALYKKITKMDENDTIDTVLQRNNEEIVLHYTVQDFKTERESQAVPDQKPVTPTLSPQALKQEQRKILEQKYKFAPTAQEIREQERRNMLQQGRRYP
jgi:type II secretory pathway component PulC